jgi:two-component system cell cycle response regulator
LLDRAAPASELVNLQSLLEWQQTMLASRSLTELVARARYYPGAEGGPAAVSMLIADATHELRHLLIGSGESDAPASVSFVDSLYRLAPQLSAHAEPWVGTYRPADHGLLFGADPTLRHVAVYPLLARGALVGALNLAGRHGADGVASPQPWLRRHVGVAVGCALERLLDRARLLRTGVSDSVAGWHSRVYFQGRLREELARSQRYGSELTCLLVDVDGLRAINDRYGQVAGDVVLNEVAERLQSQIRTSDSCAHLGGDEFAVLLPQTGIAEASPLAQRILAAVRAGAIVLPGPIECEVTVSIGVAALSLPKDSDRKAAADHLLATTSAALHAAKVEGRNRYVVARPSMAG